MVRASKGGRLFDEFKSDSAVGIGWSAMGDMNALATREQFAEAVAKAWPDAKPMQAAMSVSHAFRFVREIKAGDRILTTTVRRARISSERPRGSIGTTRRARVSNPSHFVHEGTKRAKFPP